MLCVQVFKKYCQKFELTVCKTRIFLLDCLIHRQLGLVLFSKFDRHTGHALEPEYVLITNKLSKIGYRRVKLLNTTFRSQHSKQIEERR
jgi:hypothetical protein